MSSCVARCGVLLINLGSPTRPSASAIARYLREFLSDTRVVEIPSLLWWPILNGIILPLRSRKNIPKYQSIWLSPSVPPHSSEKYADFGSPLHVYSQRFTDKLQRLIPVPVAMAMRYGEPSLDHAMARLREQGCTQIVAVPLYPQYASSTTGTVMEKIYRLSCKKRVVPKINWFGDEYGAFATAPFYINALLSQWEKYIAQQGRPERLILSFHGLPKAMIAQGDIYQTHCEATANALRANASERLGMQAEHIIIGYQSRFGAQQWLTPSTQTVLEGLPQSGIKKVAVACPGFVVDCLETLEEINGELREAFRHQGGEIFHYWSCLNDDDIWVEAFAKPINALIHSSDIGRCYE